MTATLPDRPASSDHGPQPAPPPGSRHVLMDQWWQDLTFVHWAVDPALVADRMPPGVQVDVRDGVTWVGLVLFDMVDAGFGRGHPVPWFGTFLETNVRLYSVDDEGRHGVVFLSLDCDRLPVVAAARASLRVPYRWARMSHQRTGSSHGPDGPAGTVHRYTARLRTPRAADRACSDVTVRVGQAREADDLDHFLTARFGLHTQVLGQPLWVPNAHDPWPLHEAEVVHLEDELVASVGLPGIADRAPDHVRFSPGVRTVFGFPRRR